MAISFKVNGKAATVDVPADMPLLWVLRDVLDLKGTKFGCGIGAVRRVHGAHRRRRRRARASAGRRRSADAEVTTIEGLSPDGTHAAAARVAGARRAAVRLLPGRPADVGGGAAREERRSRPTRTSTRR